MHKRLLVIIGAGVLVSCQKKTEQPSDAWSWFGTQTKAVYNYVLINATQVASGADSNEMHIDVSAAFIDSSNHQVAAVSTLRVNNKEIAPGNNYLYSYNYGGNDRSDEPAFGSDVKINIRGTEEQDTVSSQVYLPKRLKTLSSAFPSQIHKPDGYTLNWIPDLDNTWGKVMIQLYYFAELSTRADSTLPARVPTVNITVPDNGSYFLTATDLTRFPTNAYLGITIARGTQTEATLPLSKKRIYYFTSAAVSTAPIQLVP